MAWRKVTQVFMPKISMMVAAWVGGRFRSISSPTWPPALIRFIMRSMEKFCVIVSWPVLVRSEAKISLRSGFLNSSVSTWPTKSYSPQARLVHSTPAMCTQSMVEALPAQLAHDILPGEMDVFVARAGRKEGRRPEEIDHGAGEIPVRIAGDAAALRGRVAAAESGLEIRERNGAAPAIEGKGERTQGIGQR